MGRHSSPEQWPFYRSVVGWLLPWVMIAGVVGVAVWVAVASVGGKDVSPELAGGKAPAHRADSVTATPPETSAPAPAHTHKPKPPPEPEPEDTPSVLPKLITNGVSVQVLNGSGTTGADQAMADRLTTLGFRIVAVVEASKPYDKTTVFWSSNESRPAAEALAQHFGWLVQPKPHNLSPEVSVHVVVGKDEARG
jgi:hypothetical protein